MRFTPALLIALLTTAPAWGAELVTGHIRVIDGDTFAMGRVTVEGRDVGEALIALDMARPWCGHREPWCRWH